MVSQGLTPDQKEHARTVQDDLRGMVPELSDGNLNFRPATENEQPLKSGQRRQIARWGVQGVPETNIAEVLSQW